jgi:hypothetical protein
MGVSYLVDTIVYLIFYLLVTSIHKSILSNRLLLFKFFENKNGTIDIYINIS